MHLWKYKSEEYCKILTPKTSEEKNCSFEILPSNFDQNYFLVSRNLYANIQGLSGMNTSQNCINTIPSKELVEVQFLFCLAHNVEFQKKQETTSSKHHIWKKKNLISVFPQKQLHTNTHCCHEKGFLLQHVCSIYSMRHQFSKLI